jgi:WD40 repeat protein
MRNTKNDDRLKPVLQQDNAQPEVYGMTKGKEGLQLGRRAFLGTLGVGVVVSASGGKKVFAEENVKGQSCRNLRAHSQPIESVAISPDGKLLASGSDDQTIKLWSLPEGKVLHTLGGHQRSVTSVAISPDGTLLASGSSDNTIQLWALPEGKLLQTLEGHTSSVFSVAISPDGKFLASGSGNKTIKLWGLPEGKLLQTLEGHTNSILSVAISPDGKFLASESGDKTIKLWAVPEGTLLQTLTGHSDWVNSVTISPDGKLLVSGSQDQTIKLWALPDGEPSWCLFDPALTETGTAVNEYRQMEPKIIVLPCGSPIPPDATCICNCVAGSIHYPGTEMVCICDTIMVPAGTAFEGICVCHTIAVGTYVPQPTCSCVGHVTCSCVGYVSGGGHYWYPN